MPVPRKLAAAVITVRQAKDMTKKGRKQIADWMRKQAAFLEENGDCFSDRFTARYLYR